MDADRESEVMRLVRLAVRPSKCAGLFPLGEYRGQFYLSKTLFFLTVLLLSAYCVLTVGKYLSSDQINEEVKYNEVINFVQSLCMYLTTVVSVFRLLTSQSAFNDSIQTLHEVEVKLNKMGCSLVLKENKFFWIEISLLIGAIGLRIVRNLTNNFDKHDTYIITFYYLCLLTSMSVIVNRFKGIMDICERLFVSCNKEIRSDFRSKENRIKLESYLFVHSRLYSVCTSYSTIEMPQLLLVLLASFIISVSEFYKVLVLMGNGCTRYKYLSVIVKVSWIGIGSTLIWKIVTSCWSCSHQAKQFNILIFQLMINDKTNVISNNEKLRLHIAMRRELVFTGCGLFVLDYTLIHSMAAAATTYLVILLQLGGIGTAT